MVGHYFKRGCKCDVKNCSCNKKWSFAIDIGMDPKTGKRQQKTKGGFKTKKDAEVAAAALLTEVNQKTFIKESDILFKDFANEWLPIYSDRTGAKPGTIRLRKYSIKKLLPYFAHIKLKNITEEMYQEALHDLKDQNLFRSTIECIHTTGKMIFKMATNKRILKLDPTVNAYIKKDQKKIIESDAEELPKYFEKEELDLFLDTVSEKGLYMDNLIFLTLSYTGMRVGELVALKWKDIDFENHTIRITKTYYNENNNTIQYQLVSPKTSKSRRKIMVDKKVTEAFRKHKMEQEKIIAHFGNSYFDNGYIFANFNRHPGYPILIKLVESRMARLLKKVELNTELTPHSLRHTHTSLLAEAGVDLEEIMDRLGHHDDDVTRKVYLHLTTVMRKGASDKFSKLMLSIK
jgi:integrase